jgi:hypothetical protein
MKFSRRVFDFAFGCHHRQLSRVFTIQQRTYQVCLSCGRQVEYSWSLMRSERTDLSDHADEGQSNSSRAEAALI